jgi:alpha-amylase/alpha-mannosidase (GH57 family)
VFVAPGYACARQCSPGYARDLVARIRLHAAKNSTVFRQWPVFL